MEQTLLNLAFNARDAIMSLPHHVGRKRGMITIAARAVTLDHAEALRWARSGGRPSNGNHRTSRAEALLRSENAIQTVGPRNDLRSGSARMRSMLYRQANASASPDTRDASSHLFRAVNCRLGRTPKRPTQEH